MKITLHRGEILFRQGDPGEMVPHHSLISPKDCHGTETAMVTSTVKRMKAEAWHEELRNNSMTKR